MSRDGFKDHFSGHAGDYARYRPEYPDTLFTWLTETAPGRELAWDVGTGNGQAAVGLARNFSQVHATDASPQQIAQATQASNIRYRVEPAESCSLASHSADLVAVGQALHWFDFEAFFREAKRVLRPGGLMAAWTYELAQVTTEVDKVVQTFFDDVVGAWWPPERVHVDRGYRDLPFPFQEVSPPAFTLASSMHCGDYLDYISTWSAVRRCRADTGTDPLDWLSPRLAVAWGEKALERDVIWPVAIRAGFTRA